MEITHPGVVHQDQRGTIIDVLADLNFNYATIIMQKKGVVRGNHYHKKTVQWIYLLRGRLKSFSRMPGGSIETAILEVGDLWKNEPFEEHALLAVEDSEFLVLTAGVRGGRNYEKDTYRLKQSLVEQVE
jgi:quercetin dioxygenase-like cupin family protein